MFYANLNTPMPNKPLLSKCEISGQRVNRQVFHREENAYREEGSKPCDGQESLSYIGLVFYEVTCRWVEKGPDNDHSGEGDRDKEDGSDEEDEESSKVNPFPILNNDIEVLVIKSAEEKEYEQSENFDLVNTPLVEEVNTPPTEDKSNKVVDSVIEEVIMDMIKQGYGHCSSIEGRESITLLVERIEKFKDESSQNETKLFPTFTM
ncbi:hypothetical protein Syun_014326 [Stephania yunnanensis]|uniref:Uncharacterized protein n=1 Tax=Stephania yunnanensis TaxID=152371 RepID=A0AAP0PBS9_9MAGN